MFATAVMLVLVIGGASCTSQQQSEKRETEEAAEEAPTTSEPQATSITEAESSARAEELIARYEKAKAAGNEKAAASTQAGLAAGILECQLEQATGSTNQAKKEAHLDEVFQQAQQEGTNVQTLLAERGYDCGYSRAVEAGLLKGR